MEAKWPLFRVIQYTREHHYVDKRTLLQHFFDASVISMPGNYV